MGWHLYKHRKPKLGTIALRLGTDQQSWEVPLGRPRYSSWAPGGARGSFLGLQPQIRGPWGLMLTGLVETHILWAGWLHISSAKTEMKMYFLCRKVSCSRLCDWGMLHYIELLKSLGPNSFRTKQPSRYQNQQKEWPLSWWWRGCSYLTH